ncbi:hypothetical protein BCR34DRAFT_352402 [Clohesyomyces aquaticus]|uniref:Mid2 domain-containing protein n=1 Tax=Clohesyomyces aquaticus TaxID=1231657 RepID=A0A1Y1ZJY5_9PLEO|nr:hypothetical protein BCR34DRAFT_352402 [Clohesyomyces aquaticus]
MFCDMSILLLIPFALIHYVQATTTLTLGWTYLTTDSQGSIIWDKNYWVNSSLTTSGYYFRVCSVSTPCPIYTYCISGTLRGASATSICPSTEPCGADYLYSSLADNAPLYSYWCAASSYSRHTYIFLNVDSTSTPTPASTLATTTTASSVAQSTITARPTIPSSIPSPTSTSFPQPPSTGKNTKTTGIIVGGVVGGIAVVGAIVIAVLLILRRGRRNPSAPSPNTPAMSYGYASPLQKFSQNSTDGLNSHASAYYSMHSGMLSSAASPAPQYPAPGPGIMDYPELAGTRNA